MAPALSSSSAFRFATANPHSKPNPKLPRSSTTTILVFATKHSSGDDNNKKKKPFPPFRIGKRGDNGSPLAVENQDRSSGKQNNKKPFFIDIDFSKLPAGGNPSTSLLFANQLRRKDPRTVFVAGATGQAGVRIAQRLLRQGFSVRAGVPELASAQELARLAAQYKIISPEESKRLNAVESTFQDAESIAGAIGNATKVVVTIGIGENGPAEVVTTDDALQVVRAAKLAGVGHVTVVYDNGTGFPGTSTTYNVLDGISSFFSNLFSRSQPPLTLSEFLSKVAETDVGYTLIKASLSDDFAAEGKYGVVVAKERSGAANDSKVSRSQIASLVADVFANTSVAENKVFEVSASPSAPSKPIEELFSAIPEDGRRKAYAEALAKARAEEEALAASEKAREASEAAKKLEEEVKKLSEQEARATSLADEARRKAEAAGSSLEGLVSRAKDLGGELSWEKLSSQFATAVSQKSEAMSKTQVATVRGQARARILPPKKAVVKQPAPPRSRPKQPEPKPEVKKVFGGLFKQETIYIDDD